MSIELRMVGRSLIHTYRLKCCHCARYFAARAALLGQIVSMVADKIRQCSVGPSGAVATAFPPLPLPSGLQIDVGSVRATCAGGGGGSGGCSGGGNTSSVRSSSSSGGASRRCRSGGRGSGNIEGASGGAQTSGVHKYVTVPPELWPSYARVAGMFDKAAAVFAAELASAGPSSEPASSTFFLTSISRL